MARAVHGLRWLVRFAFVACLVVGGCVIPPNLTVGTEDAGVNSPPAITSVASDEQELPEPGPVTFQQGTGSMFLELLDTDLADTLFVRIFVNYNLPDQNPARSTCTAATTGAPKRTVTCDLTSLCEMNEVGLADPLSMTVVVFDRAPLEGPEPPKFQAMPEGGLSTSRFYQLNCTAP